MTTTTLVSVSVSVVITAVIAMVVFYATKQSPKVTPQFYENFEGIPASAQLISEAASCVYIQSGEMNKKVWSDQRMISAIKKAGVNRKVKFRFIFGPHMDVRNVSFIKTFYNAPYVEFRRAKERATTHYTVVDREYIQIESEHAPFSPDRKSMIVCSKLAEKYAVSFEKAWGKSEEVALEDLVATAESVSAKDLKNSSFAFIKPKDNSNGTIEPATTSEIGQLKQLITK